MGCTWRATQTSSCSYTSPSTPPASSPALSLKAPRAQTRHVACPVLRTPAGHCLPCLPAALSAAAGEEQCSRWLPAAFCCQAVRCLRPALLQAPKRVKLFVNRPTIGFSEAADSAGVQEFDLTEADLEGQQLPLKWVPAPPQACAGLLAAWGCKCLPRCVPRPLCAAWKGSPAAPACPPAPIPLAATCRLVKFTKVRQPLHAWA